MLLFLAGISKFDDQKYHEKLTRVGLYFFNPEDDDPMDFRRVACVFLQYVHAIYESQSFAIYRALADIVQEQEICMNSITLSPFHCRMLAYFLTHSCRQWKRLEMVNCSLTDSCLQSFNITALNHSCASAFVKHLVLSRCEDIDSISLTQNVFSFYGISLITLTPIFQHLEILEVSSFPVVPKDSLASSNAFAQVLQMKHLQHLKFHELPIYQLKHEPLMHHAGYMNTSNTVPCRIITEVQPVSHSLCELSLYEPSEIECIAATLQNSRIVSLHLELRQCSTSSLQRLFYQLQYIQNLRKLSLSLARMSVFELQNDVNIDPDELGGLQLQYMLMVNLPLECLIFQIDVMIDEDIVCIAKGLLANTSLKQLCIYATKECSTRLLPLLVAIKEKGNLEELSLYFPPCMPRATEEDGLVAITQVLQSSRYLQVLALSLSKTHPLEITHLAAGLTSHPSLRHLVLHLSELQLDAAMLLFKAIVTCSQLSLQYFQIKSNIISQYPRAHDEVKNACQVSVCIQKLLLQRQTVLKIHFCSCLLKSPREIHPKLLPFLRPMMQPIFESLAIKFSSLQYCKIKKLKFCNTIIVALFEFRAVRGYEQENTSPCSPRCKKRKCEVPDYENPVQSKCLLPMRWESLSYKASFEAIKHYQESRRHDTDTNSVKDCMAYIGISLIIGQSEITWLHQIEFGKCLTTSGFFSTDVAIPGPGDDPFLI